MSTTPLYQRLNVELGRSYDNTQLSFTRPQHTMTAVAVTATPLPNDGHIAPITVHYERSSLSSILPTTPVYLSANVTIESLLATLNVDLTADDIVTDPPLPLLLTHTQPLRLMATSDSHSVVGEHTLTVKPMATFYVEVGAQGGTVQVRVIPTDPVESPGFPTLTGSSVITVSDGQTRVLSSAGLFRVTIVGGMGYLGHFHTAGENHLGEDLTKVFLNAARLTSAPLLYRDGAEITRLDGGFEGAEQLHTPFPSFTPALLRSAARAFKGTTLPTVPADHWPQLVHAPELFAQCPRWTTLPSLSFPVLTDGTELFSENSSLTSATVTYGQLLRGNRLHFENYSLTTLSLSGLDRVRFLDEAFMRCFALRALPFQTLPALRSAVRLCAHGHSLTDIDHRRFPLATDFSEAFMDCPQLIQVEGLTFDALLAFDRGFADCHSLRTVTSLRAPRLRHANATFRNCHGLKAVSGWIGTAVQSANYLYDQCYQLETANWLNPSNLVEADGLHRHNYALPTVPYVDFPKVETAKGMFEHCYLLNITATWTLPALRVATRMFRDCYSLTRLPCQVFPAVEDAEEMCAGLALPFLPDGYLSLPKATNVKGLFRDCGGQATLVELHIPNATNAEGLCENATALQRIIRIHCGNVVNFRRGFAGCGSLTELGVLDFTKVTQADALLADCGALVTLGGFAGLRVGLDLSDTQCDIDSALRIAIHASAIPFPGARITFLGTPARTHVRFAEVQQTLLDKGWLVS